MASPPLLGVILAAGKGTRIYPFSETLPKPILPVCNRPLLEKQLLLMKSCGISDVIVVIGHLGYRVVDTLGDGSRLGLSIRYVEQTETLGIAHAVGKLEPYIDSPFLLFLGDIYFDVLDLGGMIASVTSGGSNANLASKIEPDPEMIKRNFAIIEGESGHVRQVIEKPRHVSSQLKGCGMYMFDQHIFDAIRRTPRTAMRDEYEITDSIQIMINDGHTVSHTAVVRYDMNLTVPEDLLKINLTELGQRGESHLIGKGATVPADVQIDNAVIGDGAIIAPGCRVTNSLVFPGSRVSCNIDRDIIHGEQIIHCEGGDAG